MISERVPVESGSETSLPGNSTPGSPAPCTVVSYRKIILQPNLYMNVDGLIGEHLFLYSVSGNAAEICPTRWPCGSVEVMKLGGSWYRKHASSSIGPGAEAELELATSARMVSL